MSIRPIRRILVPVDLSTCSRAALGFACSLGVSLGARLEVLFVLDSAATIPDVRAGKQDLQRFIATVDTQHVELRECVDVGDVRERILAAAESGNFDAIVLGTHGRSDRDPSRVGSVAETVVRMAGCPVITIREPD